MYLEKINKNHLLATPRTKPTAIIKINLSKLNFEI